MIHLEKYTEALENYQKEFGKVMASEKNKRKLNVRLVQASGIRICPYCNRDYINSRGKKIAGAELDHFYSRKDYPVFALSLYNLVPCCGTCNRIKSNKLRAIVSPFDDKADFNQSVKFSYDKKAREVKLEGSKEHIQMFHLQEAYEIHSEEAEELMEKKMAYNTSQLEEILDLLDKNGKIITMEKLKEDIFGKYMDNNEFGKRPLAKFYHDILEQS